MTVVHTAEEVRLALDGCRSIGFVPTMGALHAGHASLLERCRSECSTTVLSIYVNPLQFGPGEDLAKYPRPLEADLAVAESCGVDVVFAPDGDHLTGSMRTTVVTQGVSDRYEGASRPGHFDGVATIVGKLLNIVGPESAYFGLKDLQQCAVVRQMVRDLAFDTNLVFCETVREASGLALSSRNQYLDTRQRNEASLLYKTLCKLAGVLRADEPFESAVGQALATLGDSGFETEYLDMVDSQTMEPIRTILPDTRLVVASRYCNVRLIDNIAV